MAVWCGKKSTWNRVFKTRVPHSPHSMNRPLLLLPQFFSSSFQIWFFFFFFFLPNLVLSSGYDLVLYSSSLSSRSSSIEIESYRLGFTFYKLESIRLKIYMTKKPPEQQVKLEFLRLEFQSIKLEMLLYWIVSNAC